MWIDHNRMLNASHIREAVMSFLWIYRSRCGQWYMVLTSACESYYATRETFQEFLSRAAHGRICVYITESELTDWSRVEVMVVQTSDDDQTRIWSDKGMMRMGLTDEEEDE